jgi:hypothetical protein
MKRNTIIAAIVALIIIVGIGIYMLFGGSEPSKSSEDTTTASVASTQSSPVAACDILTKTIAKAAIGDNLSDTPPASGSSSSDDLSVTNCTYTTKANASTTPIKISGVSLLVRSGLTTAGIASNTQAFTASRPDDAQNIMNIGDRAFYSPRYRQLNVLKGNNWYILMLYKDSVTNSSLASTKALAQKLSFK